MQFLEKYNNIKNFRFKSFEFALNEATKRKHKIIVETGVARGKIKFFLFSKINWKDGMSTMIFSDYAKYHDGKLYSCDISKKNVENAKKFTKHNKNHVTFFVEQKYRTRPRNWPYPGSDPNTRLCHSETPLVRPPV